MPAARYWRQSNRPRDAAARNGGAGARKPSLARLRLLLSARSRLRAAWPGRRGQPAGCDHTGNESRPARRSPTNRRRGRCGVRRQTGTGCCLYCVWLLFAWLCSISLFHSQQRRGCKSHDIDGGEQVVEGQRFVDDVRLDDFAGAVDNALLDARVMDDETLIVGAGTTYVAGGASENCSQRAIKGGDEGRFGADPRGAGGVSLRVFVA